jgi:iron complex transport system ATP-binding protein
VRARRIGFLPQHFEPHWDLAVGDLVRLGAARDPELAVDAAPKILARFELGGLERRRWSTLSGGERARVLLAMVLVADPPILLADEPAAALDIRHRLDVIGALAARGRDRLSVVVVHDLDLAFRFFERVVVMVKGRIVADAPAAALLADPRLDAAFGVRFERIRTAEGWSLQASRSPA